MHHTSRLKGIIVQKNITQLGPREAEFLTCLAAETDHRFTIDDAVAFWGSPAMAWKKLWRLEQKGWIARVERGKYIIIPLEAGSKRIWSEDPYLIAKSLVEPAVIAYWSAIRYWDWTEQLPNIIFIQTTRRKKKSRKKVFGVPYEIVTIPEGKFFGYIKQWRNEIDFLVTDKEKTLIDCADDVNRSGSIEELIKAVKEGAKEISWDKLGKYVDQFPNGAVKKRLGFLFEFLVPEAPQLAKNLLNKWQSELTSGISPLVPGGIKTGKISSRWRILNNAEL